MEALRASRPLADLRAIGSFFTSPEMAEALWGSSLQTVTQRSRVFDPAVGAGDLLLPPARHFATLEATPVVGQVGGTDIDSEFLVTAERRLQLLAPDVTRRLRLNNFFDRAPDELKDASHVVMNPPFFKAAVNDEHWKSTTINAAAIFVERSLELMAPGARLLSILPEVLRSGSRYESWRRRIAKMGRITRIQPGEQFDARTDVHIFFFEMIKGDSTNPPGRSWPATVSPSTASTTVGSYAQVQVGAVVPHRHPEIGPTAPYASTSDLAPWEQIEELPSKRRFSGRLNKGPLVLVRRTSRPGDRYRAQATIYTGRDPIAVENHLLILTPIEPTIELCKRISAVLSKPETNTYLNDRIRLRHLTVGAVREIPWSEND